ncbi:hemolysin family protein [Massilia sp. W12]|uniref:hemolysin family protein n=1 Tax=Massilia sp. W12 TaxID=3126507 RepID=UPI0030D4B9F3
MDNFFLVILALFLVALNGFFVAAEFSIVKLRASRARQLGKNHGLRGDTLQKVHGKLDNYLSACQLGITLASLGLGWIGEPAFARLLEPVISLLGITNPKLTHGIAFFFAFFTISFLHIVIGELAPKSLAIRRPDSIALWTALPLYAFYWAMFPAIWCLNASANWVLRIAGLDQGHGHDHHYSPEEIKMILRGSNAAADFSRDEWNIVAQTLDFRSLEVSDLMRPIQEMRALHADLSAAQNLEIVRQHRYSRYPYFAEDGKTVLGVLHLKDLFLAQGMEHAQLQNCLHKIEIVPPKMPALELFRRFRSGSPHFALVEGHEQYIGFVTLDNLLSALVGHIRDEFSQSDNDWLRLDDGSLLGKGSLPLFTLERALGLDIENDEVDSVGGLLMHTLGEIPHEGQKVDFDGFSITVKKMQGPRIVLLKVRAHDQAAPGGH